MARPTIVEQDYFRFQQALQRAVGAGQKIDPADKERWKGWVRENQIKEGAFMAFGNGMYEGLQPVILDTGDDWQGYYLVSTQDEACLKWTRPTEE